MILGGGLAGLSVAWHLQKRGRECCVFEKEPALGGLCRSKEVAGFTFDCDGHILHFKHRYVFNLIKALMKGNLAEHKRSAWIHSFDTYIRYPFQVNLYGLPPVIVKECLEGFIEALKNGHPAKGRSQNLLDWVSRTFGRGISRHFLIPYNTKFWTVPPQELTCEWLDGFIPVPSLDQILEGTLEESQRQFGYNARFWYPQKGGINQIPLAFASQLKSVYTGCAAVGIDLKKKEVRLSSGDKEHFDYLVSTIPLPEMAYLVKGLPRQITLLMKKLRWNSVLNVNLGIEKKDETGRHWIYFPYKDTSFFRVGFFHNFSSSLAPRDKSSLYVEASYSKERPLDKNNISLRIKEDLKRVGLLSEKDRIVVEDTNDIKYGYPIYDRNYHSARSGILSYCSLRQLIPCGRYGSWRYMSMGDVILDGKLVADNLVNKK